MLGAVGIPGVVALRVDHFSLEVAEPDAHRALSHLAHYEAENRPPRPPPPAPPLHPNAWAGCVGYAVWLLGVAYAISNGLVRLDAFHTGELDAARVQSGQWCRQPGGRHLVRLPCGAAARRRRCMAPHRRRRRDRQSPGRPFRSPLASIGRRLHRGLHRARPDGGLHLARAPAAAAELGPTLGSARGRHRPARMAGHRGQAHRHHGPRARLRVLLGAAAAIPAVTRRLHDLPQWPAGLAAVAIMAAAWGLALAS